MNVAENTFKCLDETLRKVVAHYEGQQDQVLSDLYFHVAPATGELSVSDDDDVTICQVVVPEWKGVASKQYYQNVQECLQTLCQKQSQLLEQLPLFRPFGIVLVGDDHETIADLYLVDDDTILLPGGLMEGLEDDLNDFLKQLMDL